MTPLPSPDPWSYPVHCGPSALTRPRPALRELDYSHEPEKAKEPYPAPVITSRDGHEVPDKQAVRDLTTLAESRGWSVVLTYAKGYPPHASRGTPLKLAGSIAVRMRRGSEQALAVYNEGSTWTWDTLYMAGRRYGSITALKEAL